MRLRRQLIPLPQIAAHRASRRHPRALLRAISIPTNAGMVRMMILGEWDEA